MGFYVGPFSSVVLSATTSSELFMLAQSLREDKKRQNPHKCDAVIVLRSDSLLESKKRKNDQGSPLPQGPSNALQRVVGGKGEKGSLFVFSFLRFMRFSPPSPFVPFVEEWESKRGVTFGPDGFQSWAFGGNKNSPPRP